MTTYQDSPAATKMFGVWEETIRELISYRYLGCRSVLLDREHADGTMPIRRDMRTPAGVLTAPLAIGALDAWGNIVDRFYHLGLTHIEVDVFDVATDVDRVVFRGSVVREARTQVFTEARIEARDDPNRVVAYATADWAIIGPTPPGFEYRDPGDGVADTPDLPPLWEVYHGRRRPGGGFVIDELSLPIGVEILHHGPMLVLTEAAALEAAAAHDGSEDLAVERAATRIVAPGKRGPFVVTAEVLPTRSATVCRAELRDEGYDNRLVAVALVRMSVPQ